MLFQTCWVCLSFSKKRGYLFVSSTTIFTISSVKNAFRNLCSEYMESRFMVGLGFTMNANCLTKFSLFEHLNWSRVLFILQEWIRSEMGVFESMLLMCTMTYSTSSSDRSVTGSAGSSGSLGWGLYQFPPPHRSNLWISTQLVFPQGDNHQDHWSRQNSQVWNP